MMDMQRIRAMQDTMEQRPQAPGVALARRQGQAMSPANNTMPNPAAIAAMKAQLAAGQQRPAGPPARRGGGGMTRPGNPNLPQKPATSPFGIPNADPAQQASASRRPGIEALRNRVRGYGSQREQIR